MSLAERLVLSEVRRAWREDLRPSTAVLLAVALGVSIASVVDALGELRARGQVRAHGPVPTVEDDQAWEPTPGAMTVHLWRAA